MLPVALNVPPATVQFAAVAVAFRLVKFPPVRTRPGLSLVPRLSPRLLAVAPDPKTSDAEPETESLSVVAV